MFIPSGPVCFSKQKRVKNYIALPCDMLNFKTLMELLKTKEMRRKYIEDGEKFGITFLEGSINKVPYSSV